MNQAFIGIGSNINNPNYRIFKVLKQLNHSKEITIVKKSSIYSSRPMGPQFQPNYSNIVIEIITSLEPSELLVFLKKLEKVHNRKTTKRWGPRSIDLDILIYSDNIICTEELTIPHPGIPHRDFVLVPLCEITSYNFNIPKFGKINSLLKKIT